MSETYVLSIDQEWSQVSFDHELLSILRSRNLAIDIEETYSVGTIRHGSDESSSYLMAKVSHLTAPLDTVDVVDAERTTSYVCGCPDFWFDCYDSEIGAKIEDCKHTTKAKKQNGELTAEDQETLL